MIRVQCKVMKSVLYLTTSQKQKGVFGIPEEIKYSTFIIEIYLSQSIHDGKCLRNVSFEVTEKVNFEFSAETGREGGGETSYCHSRAEDVFRCCQAE